MTQRPDGATNVQHYEQYLKSKGLEYEEAFGEQLELPEGCEFAWRAFCELSETRTTGFGPGPIRYVDMDAWVRLNRIVLTPIEIELIHLADLEWLKIHARHSDTTTKN